MYPTIWITESMWIRVLTRSDLGNQSLSRDLAKNLLQSLRRDCIRKDCSIAAIASVYMRALIHAPLYLDNRVKIAYLVSLAFLEMNGYTLSVSKEDEISFYKKCCGPYVSDETITNYYKEHLCKIVLMKRIGYDG